MNIVLPKEIAYSPSLPALPECLSQEIVLAPVNGGGPFGPSSLIQFDLVSRGFIDPSSIYLRYKYSLTNTSTDTSTIRGTPVFSFFQKLETIFGSSVVESINNYHQICNMMVNLQQDVAMKYGQQSAYGWSTGAAPSLQELDARLCVNNESGSFAAPLSCILSQSEKLIPAGLMPNIRIQLTTAPIADVFVSTAAPTNYALSNVELCYTMIDFAGDVNDIVKSMGDTFYVKSSSFKNMGATLSTGISGSSELVYNMRLASIKSLFTSFVGQNATKTVNGIFDSVDPTTNASATSGGELVYNIAGTSFPSRPVSTLNNKSAFLMELKKAVGALHSESYNSSINSLEFGANDASTTTSVLPGKFWFGVNTEKLSSNGALLTGISTQNSPINLRVSTNITTTQSYQVYLTALYDCLITIDPNNRQATIKE